ncbi:alpha/beta fold hydrolase, partial [Nocardia sp. NPDC004722]
MAMTPSDRDAITESTRSYAGVRTRVLSVAGAGTPIVLFHGFADSADTWREVLVRLARAGRTALAVDLPGFGAADPRRAGAIVRVRDAHRLLIRIVQGLALFGLHPHIHPGRL